MGPVVVLPLLPLQAPAGAGPCLESSGLATMCTSIVLGCVSRRHTASYPAVHEYKGMQFQTKVRNADAKRNVLNHHTFQCPANDLWFPVG